MQGSTICASGNLVIGSLRLTKCKLLGQSNYHVQPRVVLFQAREIQLGQLRRLDLPVLDELGQVGHREKRQVFVRCRHHNLELPSLQRSAIAWESLTRRNGIEDDS